MNSTAIRHSHNHVYPNITTIKMRKIHLRHPHTTTITRIPLPMIPFRSNSMRLQDCGDC
jgi:hypothetical protein